MERASGNLNDLETHTGDITDSVTTTTETSNQDLVVFIDEVEATIVWDEGSDLLTILDELCTATLTNSRIRLLGLDTNLLDNNSLGVGSTSEWLMLVTGTTHCLLIILVCPSLTLPVKAQLTCGTKPTRTTGR